MITKERQYYRQNVRKNEGSSNMGSVLLQPAQLYVLGLPALHLLVMLHVVTNVVWLKTSLLINSNGSVGTSQKAI